MGKLASLKNKFGRVRQLTKSYHMKKQIQKPKKLQGRAGQRFKFMKFLKQKNKKKTSYLQNSKNITRKGWIKRTKWSISFKKFDQ